MRVLAYTRMCTYKNLPHPGRLVICTRMCRLNYIHSFKHAASRTPALCTTRPESVSDVKNAHIHAMKTYTHTYGHVCSFQDTCSPHDLVRKRFWRRRTTQIQAEPQQQADLVAAAKRSSLGSDLGILRMSRGDPIMLVANICSCLCVRVRLCVCMPTHADKYTNIHNTCIRPHKDKYTYIHTGSPRSLHEPKTSNQQTDAKVCACMRACIYVLCACIIHIHRKLKM